MIGAPPEGVWPITVTGWATLLMSASVLGFLIFDKIAGKSKAVAEMEVQIRQLCDDVADLTSTNLVLSNTVTSLTETILKLTFELKGVDGQNGAKGDIREIRKELAQIQDRNRKSDILAVSVKAMMDSYEGPERREHLRRLKGERRAKG